MAAAAIKVQQKKSKRERIVNRNFRSWPLIYYNKNCDNGAGIQIGAKVHMKT